jgi:hypothetical protein
MRRVTLAIAALAVCGALAPTVALARPPYKAEFEKLYQVKPGSNLAKAGCNICHEGTDKKNRNPYGVDLLKAFGKAPVNPTEAAAGMKKAEPLLSPDKKTKYVDLIKADKLPGAVPGT